MELFYGRQGIGVASFAALAVVVLGLCLGMWQLRRADEKTALQFMQDRAAVVPALELAAGHAPDALAHGVAPLSPADPDAGPMVTPAPDLPAPASVDGQRVKVSGTFVGARSIFLDNRTRDGVAGFHVLTPLKLSGREEHVLVLRGWVARDLRERTRLPTVPTPSQPIQVVGLAVAELRQPMMLAQEPDPGPQDRLWQHVDYAKFSRWADMRLYPVILRQTVEPGYADGLSRAWNQPGTSVDRHRGYAFQWFAMTAAAVAIWLVILWRRMKSSNGERAVERSDPH